jgi:hypothetical protein
MRKAGMREKRLSTNLAGFKDKAAFFKPLGSQREEGDTEKSGLEAQSEHRESLLRELWFLRGRKMRQTIGKLTETQKCSPNVSAPKTGTLTPAGQIPIPSPKPTGNSNSGHPSSTKNRTGKENPEKYPSVPYLS